MALPVTATETAPVPQRPMYPEGVLTKFSPEGVVLRFPGNTTLCHLPADCPLLPGLRDLYSALAAHPVLSKKVHLLPPASWHMTVFDGVRDSEREPVLWPEGKHELPLAEMTSEFAGRLRELGQQLEAEGLAPPYRMRVRNFDGALIGIGIEVEGATADEERRMRRLRDRLADAMGFRAPNHETYQFHLSVAYLMRHLEPDDRAALDEVRDQHFPSIQREFTLGDVEFCTFEDMYSFPRVFYLGKNSQ
ncbi:uncharacterized protein E0L32_003574 [Thyridium curvatum]|uniref:DUF1868 domain-containing protein n=1 Tax=Thyridium curvatum TaxID=1093900 RepID=A0A507BAR4_9PEZI|nr:uncharacterized protein E0L32_003574 [Thyridium curvatum]TPX16633.1 hypothetical protein E0L32_003574 [Thyridium curvatum]